MKRYISMTEAVAMLAADTMTWIRAANEAIKNDTNLNNTINQAMNAKTAADFDETIIQWHRIMERKIA